MTCYSDTDMFGLSKSAVTNSLTFENQVSFFFFFFLTRKGGVFMYKVVLLSPITTINNVVPLLPPFADFDVCVQE